MIFEKADVARSAGKFADFLNNLHEKYRIHEVAELGKLVVEPIFVDAEKSDRVIVSQIEYRKLGKSILMKYTVGKTETDVPISIVFNEEHKPFKIEVNGHFTLSDYGLDYHVFGFDDYGNTTQNKFIYTESFSKTADELREIKKVLSGNGNSSGKSI